MLIVSKFKHHMLPPKIFLAVALCYLGWAPTYHIATDDLEFLIQLAPPPKCWNFRPVPPHLAYTAANQTQSFVNAN